MNKQHLSSQTFLFVLAIAVTISCNQSTKEPEEKKQMVQLITLDPGHFHAALVQKEMYDGVDSVVHVYAPAGNDLQLHLARINAYTTREEKPAHWKEDVYSGNDFFEKMLAEKKGNVVVLAGNNRKKTEYILKSLKAGLNVLADKPMVINSTSFDMLKKAFETAKQNNLLLYDIMTERFEITTILQRELSMMPEIFGELEKGTTDNPAVVMESGHCFYKYISGNVVVRPAWFMDAAQQGEGIVDVTTHLVDLVQWECFPEQILDYTKDVDVLAAKRWPTDMTVSQFKTITRLDSVPSYFKNNLQQDTILKVWSNGEINYQLRGVHAKVSVRWDYQAPGGNDTHYSMIRGTKANLVIRQGVEQQYKTALYIEPTNMTAEYEKNVEEQIKKIQTQYPGVELKKNNKGWEVIIPDKYREGHESHFARVTQNFLEYLTKKDMPAWEVPGMLAKYYTTTQALELSLKNKQ
jgi:predicted dehydrogenase